MSYFNYTMVMQFCLFILLFYYTICHIVNHSFSVAPEPVENCTVINQSSDTFHMKCLPGFDGGMNQTFHILVRDRQTNNVKYDNASLTKPELIIGKPKYLLEKFYVPQILFMSF